MLELAGVSKVFRSRGRTVEALKDVNLTVERGEFVSVLGPSGCGKSTLLHLLGGFETATAGTVTVDGKPVTGPSRSRGMVFQHATLFPWRNVVSNVAWPLEVDGVSRADARARAVELLDLVGLAGFEEARPGELSGGMRQRAALARTLAMEPDLLLMDEPFGALDAQTRELMQEELTAIWQQSDLTVVFITHDISEAIFLGDRTVVMGARPGRIIESTPIELSRPRSAATKHDPKVLEYHDQFWSLIRDELEPERVRS